MSNLENNELNKTHVRKIPLLNENFGLNQNQFFDLVERMRNGDDSFITLHMYHQLEESIKYLQKRFNISQMDAYDVCMETFIDFRKKLIQNKIQYGNLRFLYSRMCANQFIDGTKKSLKVNAAVKSFLQDTKETNTNKEQLFSKLDHAILKLSTENQSFLNEIYYSGQSLETIAEKRDISYSALRKKKERLLKKIKSLIIN